MKGEWNPPRTFKGSARPPAALTAAEKGASCSLAQATRDLAGAVIVHRIRLRELPAQLFHLLVGELEDGGHGRGLFLGGSLHQLAPAADK